VNRKFTPQRKVYLPGPETTRVVDCAPYRMKLL
jgi:hypothetical protein